MKYEQGDDPETWLLQASGTGDFQSLNRQDRLSLNSSVVYEFNSRIKIRL